MRKSPQEEFKTLKDVFSLAIERSLFKLISQGYFDGLESPLSIGKEANIFTAMKAGERVIVKIYRIATCNFYKMYDYLRTDPRFPNLRRSRRQIVFSWAKREYRNLLKAREAGARVPKPIAVLDNILVMEFIGNGEPSPKLKDKHPEDAHRFFTDVLQNMHRLYKAGLIHADLSPFNILNKDEKPVFIDMSQTTTVENPNARAYLERDIKNICDFFSKLKVNADREKIIKDIESERTKKSI